MIITVTFSIQCRFCGQKMFTENGDIAIERQERQFIVRDDWAGITGSQTLHATCSRCLQVWRTEQP